MAIYTPPHRILIVEDERLYAQALRLFLEDRGYEVVVAANGLLALMELQKQHFDLLLLDVNMPGLDGFDICMGIKADPRYASIPVVFLTSEDDSNAASTAYAAGCEDFVSKGTKNDELLSRLQAVLRQRNPYTVI
jgi:DNA-binding response OmpR family regulator